MIRPLLLDDQELICQGLRVMLNLESDLEVVGVADNSQVAVQASGKLNQGDRFFTS